MSTRTVQPAAKLFDCDECGKKFASKGNANKHKKACGTFVRTKKDCDRCGRHFIDRTALEEHLSAKKVNLKVYLKKIPY